MKDTKNSKPYTIETASGPITYNLTRKKVRNINLRVSPGGQIDISAPKWVSLREIDTFVKSRSAWISKTRDKFISRKNVEKPTLCDDECLALFFSKQTQGIENRWQGIKLVDDSVIKRAAWILAQREEAADGMQEPPRPEITNEECLALFAKVSDKVFPLFENVLKKQKPELKARFMKSRWGVCHVQKRRITLNTRLAVKPMAAIEYVVLHEYVHFIHADHQAGFHAEMARLMPDYRERRKLLRE